MSILYRNEVRWVMGEAHMNYVRNQVNSRAFFHIARRKNLRDGFYDGAKLVEDYT